MDIGILGGGIGGLSAAIALKQAGFDVSVYERHTQLSEIGAGIVCWPNACFVLEQLGT
jgi:2-polyprenyl-6-methoxyphenol hydroxylase-like FAD-dependent oxidoreductase